MAEAPQTGQHAGPDPDAGDVAVYSATARSFHWIVALLILVQIPVGAYMSYRGGDLNIWDATTNLLYSGHKFFGVVILLLVAARLIYRLAAGMPGQPGSLTPWQRTLSALNHWSMYVLLLGVPLLGYVATSMYGALSINGWFSLPAIATIDKKMSKEIFEYHEIAAFALLALVVIHIAAALYHHLIQKDLVLARMLPGILRKPRA